METMAPRHIEIVNGQVAQTVINTGPMYFGVRPACQTLDRLKSALPRACHAELEWLLENSDLTARDLLKAKRHSALGCKNGRLVRQNVVVDRVAGSFFMVQLMVMMIGVGITGLMAQNFNSSTHAALWISLSVLSACMLMIGSIFFFPQSTAKRAMEALLEKEPTAQMPLQLETNWGQP